MSTPAEREARRMYEQEKARADSRLNLHQFQGATVILVRAGLVENIYVSDDLYRTVQEMIGRGI